VGVYVCVSVGLCVSECVGVCVLCVWMCVSVNDFVWLCGLVYVWG
jgi:hypothetical protein